jgi:hypothetical protein
MEVKISKDPVPNQGGLEVPIIEGTKTALAEKIAKSKVEA